MFRATIVASLTRYDVGPPIARDYAGLRGPGKANDDNIVGWRRFF
jgi:hypothetical protein